MSEHRAKTRKTYSIVDMVVLGILQNEPMNPYLLTQYVEQHNVTRLVKLSTPAIYKSCKRLYEQGALNGKLMRDGEAPEKTVYSVNRAGKKRFGELMTHYADEISPFYFDINSVVYSLEHLSFEKGLALIDTYEQAIKTMQGWLIPHSKEVDAVASFANRQIVKQYLMVVAVLVKWIEELRKEFKKEHGG